MTTLGFTDLSICDNGFFEIASLANIVPGQLIWMPALRPNSDLSLLQIRAVDPSESSLSYNFVPFSISESKKKSRPLMTPGKGSTDFYIATVGKTRLGVVLQVQAEAWDKFHPREVIFCVPKFTFKPNHDSDFVVKIQTFQYPDLFYLPPESQFGQEESALRFDHIQGANADYCVPQKVNNGRDGVKLTENAYKLMLFHLSKWLGMPLMDATFAKLQTLIDNYRGLVESEYQKVRVVVK